MSKAESTRAWEKTPAGKESRKRYEQSAKGKASRRQRKASSEYKAKAREWAQTEDGKESRRQSMARYVASEKGQETKARHAETEGCREALIRNKHRRRARARKVAVIEPIDRSVVFERDCGRCQACGEALDLKTWEMDHIVPLGPGDHAYENVRAVCRPCNRKKIHEDKRALARWRSEGGDA